MKVLAGIDGGSQQQAALALAAQLARDGELHVATVYPVSRTTAGLGKAYEQAARDAAAAVATRAGEQLDAVPFESHAIADLHTGRALHDAAVELGADVIVIGACHRGAIGHAVLGGTAESIVHGSPRPVVVAPRDYAGDGRIGTVGVAYDGEHESELALDWAQRFAAQTGASLRLLSAVTFVPAMTYPGFAGPSDQAILDELQAEARRRMVDAIERLPSSVAAEAVVLRGAIVPSLVSAAADVDILVVGSRGYGPLGALLMGSVTRGVTHAAPCPVVVVPRSTEAEHAARNGRAAMAAAD